MKYSNLLLSAKALFETQPNTIALLSNASAFIFENFTELNWVGFYLYDGKQLTVGPFQGRVACSTIELGRGVCGEAAKLNQTLVIKDVLSHENHIACDANSRSEVVVPITIKGHLYGVLDVDSPIFNRFDPYIVEFLKKYVDLLLKFIDK